MPEGTVPTRSVSLNVANPLRDQDPTDGGMVPVKPLLWARNVIIGHCPINAGRVPSNLFNEMSTRSRAVQDCSDSGRVPVSELLKVARAKMFDQAPMLLGSEPVKSLVFESRRPMENKYMSLQLPIESGKDEVKRLSDIEKASSSTQFPIIDGSEPLSSLPCA